MKRFFELETRTHLLLIFFLICIHFPAYILFSEGSAGKLLYGFLVLFVCISLLMGSVTGLYCSLVFLFVVGTFLFYFSFTNSPIIFDDVVFPLPLFLAFGFALIVLVLLAGGIHDRIVEQAIEIRRLKEEVRQYVAVDVETGFDNKHRMAIEIQSEMKRVERYGGAFTLVLLQMDYFENFKRLYGEKETSHLLSSLAESMEKTIRLTDRKFRYENDRFALLLTNTDDQYVDVIYDKLAERITNHQLLNGKYVSLSFRSGHIVFNKDAGVRDYETLFSQVESEMVAREL